MQNKKIKIIIITIVALIIAVGIFYAFYINKSDQKGEFFQIIDNKENIIWSEDTGLDQESRSIYEQRINVIQNELIHETEIINLTAYYSDLGVLYRYLGDYRSSYDSYMKSLEVGPELRRTWLNLGDTLVEMRAYQSAEKAFQKAIELFNYDTLGYKKLAELYAKIYPDDTNKTRQVYEDGLVILENSASEDVSFFKHYAKWLVSVGEKEEAINIYEKLKIKEPENAEAYERDIRELRK